MKTYLISFLFAGIFLSVFPSATSTNTHAPEDSLKNNAPKRYASNLIYGTDCINHVAPAGLSVKLSEKPVYAGDSVHDIAFLSSDGLRELARCNGLDYKTSFEVYAASESNLSYTYSMQGDTASFTIPFGLLTPVQVKGYKNVYEFSSGMKTSFFKANKVSNYDTTMVTAIQLQVKNK